MPVVEPVVAEDLDLIRDAAAEAGRIALRYFGKEPEVWMKGGVSPVSEADYAVDRYLRETLMAARPDYGWLSEETVDTPHRLGARRTFVVDPIDGTRAFLEGNETWCVSIGVVEAGRPIAGVLDCPAKKEVFAAARGMGAVLNGRQLVLAAPRPNPLVAGPKAFFDHLPKALADGLKRAAYVPSLAYRLAMVASGALDATFIKPNSHDWDLAAADLILGEAGGRLVDPGGRALAYAGERPVHGALAAGSGPLLDSLVGAIASIEAGNAPQPVPKRGDSV